MSGKYSIIRAAANAWGKCLSKGGGTSPECHVVDVANLNQLIFYTKYAPSQVRGASATRDKEIQNYQADLEAAKLKVRAGFPSATAADLDIHWSDFTETLINADGSPGMSPTGVAVVYIDRAFITSLGYKPRPLTLISPADVDNQLMMDKISPSVQARVPVYMDSLVNPAMTVIVLVLVLLISMGMLMNAASNYSSCGVARALDADYKKFKKKESEDPYANSAIPRETMSERLKIWEKIRLYNSYGYDVSALAKSIGVPTYCVS